MLLTVVELLQTLLPVGCVISDALYVLEGAPGKCVLFGGEETDVSVGKLTVVAELGSVGTVGRVATARLAYGSRSAVAPVVAGAERLKVPLPLPVMFPEV